MYFYNLHVRKYGLQSFYDKQDYYLMAAQFLNAFGFTSEKDRTIWAMHTEGLVPADISKKICSLGFKANKDTVRTIIKRLEKLMRSGLFFGD